MKELRYYSFEGKYNNGARNSPLGWTRCRSPSFVLPWFSVFSSIWSITGRVRTASFRFSRLSYESRSRQSRGNECSTGIRLRITRWRTRGMPGCARLLTPFLTSLTDGTNIRILLENKPPDGIPWEE